MKKIAFITSNQSKFNEVRDYFKNSNIEIISIDHIIKVQDLPELQSFDAKEVIKHKLKQAIEHYEYLGEHLLVEDTSLYMDALYGFPGPYAKSFLKQAKTDGVVSIAEKLENNKASATTHIGYYNQHEVFYFEGTATGRLVKSTFRLNQGFEDIFIPDTDLITFSEMISSHGIAYKNKHSMRGKALENMKVNLK